MTLIVPALLGLACSSSPEDVPSPGGGDSASGGGPVAWTRGPVPSEQLSAPRGWQIRRAITHLHSPWSHDACDGEPLPDGTPDRGCLADLRAGLCDAGIDVAWLTDHPAHASEQEFAALLHLQAGDRELPGGGAAWRCADGREVLVSAGLEGGLMPLGMEAHLPEAERGLYGETSAEAVAALSGVGALPFIAHTEGRELADLQALQAAGLLGVEVFNIHAMFDPSIRQEDLGLGGLDWVGEIAPFTSPEGTAEPDLLFLGVLAEQAPSVASWDALSAAGPMAGIGGSDAHQNVLPLLLRDEERGDSYRRMLRWLSNHLLVEAGAADDLAAHDAALAAGRLYVVFEVLGTPEGFGFSLARGGEVWEMGSRVAGAGGGLELVVDCPALAAGSPRQGGAPEIQAVVYRDGQPWREGCGSFVVEETGVYRVRIDITPWHLEGFLGDDPLPWLRSWPWIYSNPITIAADDGA